MMVFNVMGDNGRPFDLSYYVSDNYQMDKNVTTIFGLTSQKIIIKVGHIKRRI